MVQLSQWNRHTTNISRAQTSPGIRSEFLKSYSTRSSPCRTLLNEENNNGLPAEVFELFGSSITHMHSSSELLYHIRNLISCRMSIFTEPFNPTGRAINPAEAQAFFAQKEMSAYLATDQPEFPFVEFQDHNVPRNPHGPCHNSFNLSKEDSYQYSLPEVT